MSDRVQSRWWVVLGAILIQASLGAIYAWSVFTPPLVKVGWSSTETQIVFSVGLAFFAIVMVIAGRIMPKIGPRRIAMLGGVVLGLGYILAGLFGGTNFYVILFSVGVIGGSGIGLAYVVPIAVGMRWFPDKKGFITGLAVAGFGFGAMFWVKMAGSWGNLLVSVGLSKVFLIYGVLFLVTVVLGSVWMVYPPANWKPEGWTGEVDSKGQKVEAVADLLPSEMLRTPQFYMIFVAMIAGTGAGLMSIGLMKLFPMSALMENGVSEAAAASIAGTAMAVFFSLANGLGRILWGMISDKIGRKASMAVMLGSQGVIVILFQWMAGSPLLLYIGATLIGFNFGGNFALFPTITADTFGTKHIGQNYGWVFLAYGVGGIFGPILGGRLGDLRNFPLAFTVCGVLCLVAMGIVLAIRRPGREPVTQAQVA